MTIHEALAEAIQSSLDNKREETGGMIIKHKDKEDYLWAPMHNDMAGTPTAMVLFVPNEDEYIEKVVKRFKEGYRMYASFHTHPTFASYPSTTDTSQLFPNHHVNYIFSIIHGEIAKYTWVSETKLKREIVDLNLCQLKSESPVPVASVVG